MHDQVNVLAHRAQRGLRELSRDFVMTVVPQPCLTGQAMVIVVSMHGLGGELGNNFLQNQEFCPLYTGC